MNNSTFEMLIIRNIKYTYTNNMQYRIIEYTHTYRLHQHLYTKSTHLCSRRTHYCRVKFYRANFRRRRRRRVCRQYRRRTIIFGLVVGRAPARVINTYVSVHIPRCRFISLNYRRPVTRLHRRRCR